MKIVYNSLSNGTCYRCRSKNKVICEYCAGPMKHHKKGQKMHPSCKARKEKSGATREARRVQNVNHYAQERAKNRAVRA